MRKVHKEKPKNGVVIVQKEGKYGAKVGNKWIAACIYNEIGAFNLPIFLRRADSFGYIDRTGKEIIPIKKYENRTWFSEGRIVLKFNGCWSVLDKRGRTIAKFGKEIRELTEFYGGRCKITDTNGRVGFLNKNGKVIIPLNLSDASDFANGSAAVSKWLSLEAQESPYWENRTGYGIIDSMGRQLMPFNYENIGPYSKNGLMYAQIAKYNRVALINSRNELITPYMFDYNGDDFYPKRSPDLFKVSREGKTYFLNARGEIILTLDSHCIKAEYDYEFY
jgi:hypothetical protein